MSKARDLANAGTALTTVSATELGYLDGVTSAVQTQINSKIGQSTAINPTLVDAKGDIIAATAADTVSRLAVGTNGQVLTADSAESTGMKWVSAAASGGMTLISTTNLSGNITTISSIPSTYKHLLLTFTDISTSAAYTNFQMRVNGLSTALYTNVSVMKAGNTGTPETNFVSANGQLQFANLLLGAGSTVPTRGYGSINLYDYTSNLNKQGNAVFNSHNGDGQTFVSSNYVVELTSTISSISLLLGSGRTFSTGAVKLYGVS
jgi:hypothetical protein